MLHFPLPLWFEFLCLMLFPIRGACSEMARKSDFELLFSLLAVYSVV